jgi:hypothetical protein
VQALSINWVAQPRRFTPLGLLLTLAAAVCVFGVAMDYLDADADQSELLDRQSHLARIDKSKKRGPSSNETLGREAALSAAQIDAQLQLPWNELLQAIESCRMASVALMGLEAQSGSRVLHLTGEVKQIEDALIYVKKLRATRALRDVFLVGQEEKMAGNVKVIRFTVEANWGYAP